MSKIKLGKKYLKYCTNCDNFQYFELNNTNHSSCCNCFQQMCGLRLDDKNQRKKIKKILQSKHLNEWRKYIESEEQGK